MLLTQTQIQKRGGPCAKYPSTCVIRDLLNMAKLLKWNKKLRILDLTYGQGIFYYAIKSKTYIVAFDIKQLDWIVKPHEFYNISCQNWKRKVGEQQFDLVVVDPPFSHKKHKRTYYYENGTISLCLNEALKAGQHYNTPILIHFMWKTIPYGYKTIAEIWFQGRTRYANLTRPTWFGIIKHIS